MRTLSRMRIRASRLTISAMMGLGLLTTHARADLVTYDTSSNWQQAVTGFQTITFGGLAPDNSYIGVPVPPGLTLDGATLTVDRSVSDANLWVYGKNMLFFGGMLSTQPVSSSPPLSPANLEIFFPSGTTAVAFDLSGGNPTKFAFSTGDVVDPTLPADSNGMTFFGVTSTQPFTSLEVTVNDVFWINFKSVSFGQAAEVPEPSSLPLLTVAIALISIWRLRRGMQTGSR